MGEVYLAQDTTLDRKVALKILPSEFADDRAHGFRFFNRHWRRSGSQSAATRIGALYLISSVGVRRSRFVKLAAEP